MSGRHRKADPEGSVDQPIEAFAADEGPALDRPSDETPPVDRPSEDPPPAAHGSPLPTVGRAAPGPTVVASRGRAAERARRRVTRRRRLLWAAAVVAVLLLAAVATFLLTREDDDPVRTSVAGREAQRTLLVQVTGADGVAAASALVGVTDGADDASVVLIPSGLLVDAAGTGDIPFGETVTLPEPAAPAEALTDLLGVRIDDSWVMDPEALAGLVDAMGGVQAAVDVDVVVTDAKDRQTVVVRAGSQQLGGEAAAVYATYLGEGEPEQARLARFDDVLSGLLTALPDDHDEVASAVTEAGADARSTLAAAGLVGRLVALKEADEADGLVSDVLPVTEIDTGSSVTSYGIDSGQVAATMRSLFPGALQKDAGGEVLRVLVENGVGTPGLIEQARAKLVQAGFRFVNGGNASRFGPESSSVLIPDGTKKSLERGERVAESLGLPSSAVNSTERGQTVADVIVILGGDFTP